MRLLVTAHSDTECYIGSRVTVRHVSDHKTTASLHYSFISLILKLPQFPHCRGHTATYDWKPGHVPLTLHALIFPPFPNPKHAPSPGTTTTLLPLHVGFGYARTNPSASIHHISHPGRLTGTSTRHPGRSKRTNSWLTQDLT